MHTINPYKTTFTLFCRDGGVGHYPSIKGVLEQLGLGWISRNVTPQFRVYSHTEWRIADDELTYFGSGAPDEACYAKRFYRESDYIMRDGEGCPVTSATFYELGLSAGPAKCRYRMRCGSWNGEGPVPGTAKRRGGHHRGRAIRYANALRAAMTFEVEGEIALRPKRGTTLLPDRRDDYRVSSRGDRNWKGYRKTQWK